MTQSLMSTQPMCQRRFEHSCSNGVTFKSDRCDFKNGVDVFIPDHIAKEQAMADYAEMAAFHTHHIFPELTEGFRGWDAIRYTIRYVK